MTDRDSNSNTGLQVLLDDLRHTASSHPGWAVELQRLERLSGTQGIDFVCDHLAAVMDRQPRATEPRLIAAELLARHAEYRRSLEYFDQARQLALPGTLTPEHPFTHSLVEAQFAVDPADVPGAEEPARHLERNLAALAEHDPALSKRIEAAPAVEDCRLVHLWGDWRIASQDTRRFVEIDDGVRGRLQHVIQNHQSAAFFGCGACEEVLYVLQNSPVGFLGYTRPHFLFEKDFGRLKLLFQLADLGEILRRPRLILFAGPDWAKVMKETFETRRYALPDIFVGDKTPYDPECRRIAIYSEFPPDEQKAVSDYYASEAFRDRLDAISRGEVMPRVLFNTCRWTTVLQYVCESFQRGFATLGSETELLKENSDAETLTWGAYYEAMARFKPDLAFSVSHGRPSYHFFPKDLPFACFAMDNIGPILELPRLDDRVQPLDLFVPISEWFRGYLEAKGIDPGQLSTLQTPADPEIYRPLDPSDELMRDYDADISWMKHAAGEVETCHATFIREQLITSGDPFPTEFTAAFAEIYRQIMADRSRQWFEEDFFQAIRPFLPEDRKSEWSPIIEKHVPNYITQVYSASYRYHFVEPLARSGEFKLALYGHGWNLHPVLARYGRGSLSPGAELNAGYNASRINLHIHHGGSMHQRLVEGALAGAFFMVNRLDPEKNHEPLDPYFEEGREVVLFDSPKDLEEKCRYYLAHEDERREIAARMRERALKTLTIEKAAEFVLEKFKKRIAEVHG